jgi:peptidoglycan hydrolase CwlO-like protein
MKKYNLDLKTILILVLTLVVIGMIVFKGKPPIDDHKDELERLRIENVKLLKDNDSISLKNNKLDEKILKSTKKIDSIKVELTETNDRIKELENGKNKIPTYVDGLDADGVAKSLSEYLEGR